MNELNPIFKDRTILENRYKRAVTKKGSERADLIEQFLIRLNRSRHNSGFKPLPASAVAVKLSHIKGNSDLYAFYRDCDRAKSFSAYFWWALKPKRDTDDTPKPETKNRNWITI